MPFTPVATLDPERLKITAQDLCNVFGIESLHPHQEEAGQNILKGISTFLDVPTGGGKTLAFWYALFYHWEPGNNIICLVIDELHCIWEWGNNDFRPEYREIVKLAARLPTGLPILGASATAPHLVIQDILNNLGLPNDCARVEVSNEKLNVSLSVRILQHEPESLADLLLLFPEEPEGLEDFLQTMIYANGRQETEKIQDFLRDNEPECIDSKKAFEFYHRNIDEDRKQDIEKRISNGELRGVSATDALGLGMDFQTIMRVMLWMKPCSFLSLIQKIGRCVRDRRLRGQAVLFITKAMYTRCCVELELLETEEAAAQKEAKEQEGPSDDEENPEEPTDRDEALEDTSDEEEEVPKPPKKRRRKGKGKQKTLTPMEELDRRYFLEYITTPACRRIPWDKYFKNKNKKRLNFPVPEGPCCDNCSPDSFQVETIALVGGHKLKMGRKGTSSPEQEDAVRKRLEALWEQIVASDYPNQHFLTSNAIISDVVVDTLAKRARLVTSVDVLPQLTQWVHVPRYGPRVVAAIQEVLANFPDLVTAAREAQAAERSQRMLDTAAFKELQSRLVLVFDGCYKAVVSEMEVLEEASTAVAGKRKRTKKPRRRCQLFLKLPRRNTWADYYEKIKEPISVSNIKTLSEKASHYTSIAEYRADWYLLFGNARQYNIEGSQIYNDAVYLQEVFDRELYSLSTEHDLPGHELLPALHKPCHP
ncbi:P-loop containing nucleoside triphosphate hydrolase protein [Mycena maculata]|uniref:DNA 3'-5' helicase n=1 Tax=Mycena maculata TaxID=230809 RepID=A0AAD7HWU6_9AGAR|nr:P-loop containing nucleoside triphosphate hydrolase protein [Mycena maculata]